MKCGKREKLFAFAQQMLKPHEAERICLHLEECTQCGQIVDEYRRLETVLDDWTAVEPSAWFDQRIRANVASSGTEERGFPGFGHLRALAAGILSMILIVGGLIAVHQRRSRENSPSVVSQRPLVATGSSQLAAGPEAQVQPLPVDEQLKMDENLFVLENYDMLANFDVLSELPQSDSN